jgi:hypothetical protein
MSERLQQRHGSILSKPHIDRFPTINSIASSSKYQTTIIPEEKPDKPVRKDVQLLEGQLRLHIERICDEKSWRNISISEPEVLLQVVQLVMKHPLFTNLSMNSVMLFIKHCFAFIFLKKLQILYREED